MELPQQTSQHPLHTSAPASPDYETINEYAEPDNTIPANDITIQSQASHQDAVVNEKQESPSDHCITEQEGQVQVYNTIVRREGKKVTVKFAAPNLPHHHHNVSNAANYDRERNLTSLDEISETSTISEANTTFNSEADTQTGAMYSTVVRQDGKKVTIRIQAPTCTTLDEHHNS